MADLYANYAALAAVEVEGVDYLRNVTKQTGATWAAVAIHGGAIEAGSGEVAKAVASTRMNFYEFCGIKSANNVNLHITSTNFDEPKGVAVIAASQHVLSFHGYSGTLGVAETSIGGLDGKLRDAVAAALTAAGFSVITATQEIDASAPSNIANKTSIGSGVQLEMSNALRASFFPGGDLSRTMRDSGARTATFNAYVAAILSAVVVHLDYEPQLSRVQLSTVAPGVKDTFTRTVSSNWGDAESGQSWIKSGAVASDFSVAGGLGIHSLAAINSARWTLAAVNVADFDFVTTVGTSALATGGSHFVSAAGRSNDDGTTAYLARVEFTITATINLTVRKRVAGTETLISSTVATGLTHVANTQYAVRFQALGTTLRARVWVAGTLEPTTWGVELTDSSITGAGRIGCRSILSSANTNTLPVLATWDDFTTRGDAVVEKSLQGLKWSVVRGGNDWDGAAGSAIAVDDYEFPSGVKQIYRVKVYEPVSGNILFTDSDSFTATITGVWLKSIIRPFLNRQVLPVSHSDITRPSRSGVFEVIGRSFPVAVTDVMGSRRWTFTIRAESVIDADALEVTLASGDPFFIQTDGLNDIPEGYVVVSGDLIRRRFGNTSERRMFDLSLVEVAAPGADVVGATMTWAALVAEFGTWADVVAAFGTWAEVVNYVADPSVVIVP